MRKHEELHRRALDLAASLSNYQVEVNYDVHISRQVDSLLDLAKSIRLNGDDIYEADKYTYEATMERIEEQLFGTERSACIYVEKNNLTWN